MSKPTATDRLRRIVGMLPWIAAHPGVTHGEIAARFDLSVEDVTADLATVFMVGVPPYSPDAMIDVITEGDRVTVRLGDAFTQPLRLSDRELLCLYVAVRAAAEAGADDDVLRTAAAKLAATLGIDQSERISIDLGDADPDILGACRTAADQGRQLDIDYYSFSTDHEQQRRVEPHAVFARDGHWYLWAWCHRAGDDRMFRVDRIRRATEIGEPVAAAAPSALPEPRPDADRVPTVVLAVEPRRRGVVDEFRPIHVEELPDGRLAMEVAVGGHAWLARLVLTLGPHAEVLDRADRPRSLSPSEVASIVNPIGRAIQQRHQPI